MISNFEPRLDEEERRTQNSRLLIHGADENDADNTDEQALFVINN